MDYPPFTNAVVRFRSFLNDEGYSGAIGWVFPEDVLFVGAQWLIRPRPKELSENCVADVYETAVAIRLGVKLGVLCKVGTDLWCYIFCPDDQTEAEYCLMPDGLKLSIPMPLEEGRIAVDESEWRRLVTKDQVDIKRWRFK
jgi:hypothetical protein